MFIKRSSASLQVGCAQKRMRFFALKKVFKVQLTTAFVRTVFVVTLECIIVFTVHGKHVTRDVMGLHRGGERQLAQIFHDALQATLQVFGGVVIVLICGLHGKRIVRSVILVMVVVGNSPVHGVTSTICGFGGQRLFKGHDFVLTDAGGSFQGPTPGDIANGVPATSQN